VTFATPATPGSYEVRLFVNNGYQGLATSGPLGVTASSAQLVVNGVAAPGSVTVDAGSMATIRVSGGPGNTTDWVGLYAAGALDTQSLSWQYLSGSTSPPATGVSSATLHFLVPASAGSYEFRLFSNGYTQLTTSASMFVGDSMAQLVVNGVAQPNPVSAQAGSALAVSISGAPGNPTDWITLAPVGSADTASVDWRYLNDTTVPPCGCTRRTRTSGSQEVARSPSRRRQRLSPSTV